MSDYTFETVATRPTAPPPFSRTTPYTALVEAAIATLGTGRSIAVTPKPEDDPLKLRYVLAAKVQARAKRDARKLRARAVVNGGKVHVWVELTSGDKTDAPPAPAAVPDEATALEARITATLRLNPDGLSHTEIARAVFGAQAARSDSQRQVAAVLNDMSKRKLLLQDRNLLYSLTKAGRA